MPWLPPPTPVKPFKEITEVEKISRVFERMGANGVEYLFFHEFAPTVIRPFIIYTRRPDAWIQPLIIYAESLEITNRTLWYKIPFSSPVPLSLSATKMFPSSIHYENMGSRRIFNEEVTQDAIKEATKKSDPFQPWDREKLRRV